MLFLQTSSTTTRHDNVKVGAEADRTGVSIKDSDLQAEGIIQSTIVYFSTSANQKANPFKMFKFVSAKSAAHWITIHRPPQLI